MVGWQWLLQYMGGGNQDKSCRCEWLAEVIGLPDCAGGSVRRTEGSLLLSVDPSCTK